MIKPRLECPCCEDEGLFFKFTDCKKIGVGDNNTKYAELDFKDLLIPINEYAKKTLILNPKTTRQLNWNELTFNVVQNQTWIFKPIYDSQLNPFTAHKLTVWDEYGTFITEVNYVYDPSLYLTWFDGLQFAITNDIKLKGLIKLDKSGFTDPTDTRFRIKILQSGTILYFNFEFDVYRTSSPIPPNIPFPDEPNYYAHFNHPGTLELPARIHNSNNAAKVIAIKNKFEKPDTIASEMLEDVDFVLQDEKLLKWMWDFEYLAYSNKSVVPTGLSTTADGTSNKIVWGTVLPTNPTILSKWNNKTPDIHAGNILSPGDLIRKAEYPTIARVKNVDGYWVELEPDYLNMSGPVGIGNTNTPGLIYEYMKSGSNSEWKNMGEIFIMTGADSYKVSDDTLLSGMVIYNPQSFPVKLEIIICV